MKERERFKERRAITPVISAVVLTAVVLTIGGVIWAFSQGTMTISAEDYAESVIEMTDTISERFIIEHVAYGYDNQELTVWLYNYGSVDIEVKIQVGSDTYSNEWREISRGGFSDVEFLDYPADSGDELVIRAYTRRENNAYYRFIVP